jgi:hypothetical protein
LHQVQQEGLDVLVEKPGPDDAIRFLQIYETGSNDWTKDRKKSWRKTRIKLSKVSWRKGKKSLLREFVYFFSFFFMRAFQFVVLIVLLTPAK